MNLRVTLKGGLLVAAGLALAVPAVANAQTDTAPAQPAGVDGMTPPSPIGPAGPGDPRDAEPGPAGLGTPPIGDPMTAASPAGAPPLDTGASGMHQPGAHAANAPTGTGQTTISADELIGRSVKDVNGDTVGEVEDVILDGSGQAVHVILSGEGMDKKVAVNFDEMILPSPEADLELSTLTRADIETREAFTPDGNAVSLADQGVRTGNGNR